MFLFLKEARKDECFRGPAHHDGLGSQVNVGIFSEILTINYTILAFSIILKVPKLYLFFLDLYPGLQINQTNKLEAGGVFTKLRGVAVPFCDITNG